MHYEAESHFAEVRDSGADREPVVYRTGEPTGSTKNQKQPWHRGRPVSSHTAVDCSLKLYDFIDLVKGPGMRRSGFRTDQTDNR